MESDNHIDCEGSIGDAAYWLFEPTSNIHCYHVRNLLTGRYIQGYAKTSGLVVSMGNEGVEYYVAAQTSEDGRYGFACTSVTPHDFSSGTIGLNLRGESNQANCYVQTYAAAAGTNHRSFWTLNEVSDDIITDFKALPSEDEIVNSKSSNSKWYDLLGRQIMVNGQSSMVNSKLRRGIQIRQGKKIVNR
jgi:hypothetical protein